MNKSLFTLGVMLPLSLLCGKDIFVSPSGSNKNPGTANAPFATIAFAASKAQPGDTVKIGPGIYREELTIRKSGKREPPSPLKGAVTKTATGSLSSNPPGKNLTSGFPPPRSALTCGRASWKKLPPSL